MFSVSVSVKKQNYKHISSRWHFKQIKCVEDVRETIDYKKSHYFVHKIQQYENFCYKKSQSGEKSQKTINFC